MSKQKTQKTGYIKIISLALAVMFTAQACNRQQVPRVELTWWKPFAELNEIQPILEEFRKAYPNVQINFVGKNVDTYEDELIDALASGTGPDIFSIHNDWLPKHKDKMAPAPAKTLGLREYLESFVEVVSSDLTSEDQIYAVPLSVDVLALYYNKDILAGSGIVRPPATWEELVNMTPKLTRQDKFGNFERSAIALGTSDNINRAPDILGLLMLQNGVVLYSPDRKFATFDQTLRDEAGNQYNPAETALEFYTQFA
ncbi:MAG: extracellular solute-binding protein, partial [bacterium]|nr:extracellular solute-binding protein [bacterium]